MNTSILNLVDTDSTTRHYSHEEITQACKDALDNWDFGAYLENGESPEQVEARKEVLRMGLDDVENNWPDGIDLNDYRNCTIWDVLEEFTTNMS